MLVLGMLVGMPGSTALAQEGPPRHGHILLLGLEFDNGEPVGFAKCVDLAGGRALPLQAHHDRVHQGRAGEALWGAGHWVVPTAPLWPEVRNCADFEALFEAGEL